MEEGPVRGLRKIDSRRPINPAPIPDQLRRIVTPLAVDLQSHPDREFREYLLRCIRERASRVGYNYAECTCVRAKSNMLPAAPNPEVIDQYLAKEVGLGRVETCRIHMLNQKQVLCTWRPM